jgi:hypothetical protein
VGVLDVSASTATVTSDEVIVTQFAFFPEPSTADFDGDGDVDGADFLLWQRGGSPNALSQSDLALWEDHFGITILTAAASIPEPSTLLLGTLAAVGLLLRRRLS